MDEAGGAGPSAEDSSSVSTPVLRVSQLDAFELDAALEQLLWSQFYQCFQHLRPGLLTPFEPELKALLQLLLWRFTVYSKSATVGQALLNIRYKNDLSQAQRYRPMSHQQKLWFALCTVGEKWLKERSHGLFLNRPADSHVHKVRRILAALGGLAKVASLLNFLYFLQWGRFPTLTERLLGVRAVFTRPPGPRDMGFQHATRELLWHGFAEFLIFLFPLVSIRRLRAAVHTLLPWAEIKGDSRSLGACLPAACAICSEWPTMPHTIGCEHVFCYYCVKSHAIAEMCFSCPKCGLELKALESLKMQIEMTEFH
ncbi:peroxisome biogenesis factor 2 isoform X1 [Scleropages formosus]|uniref:Peroxisome biogenesis factor 2 n=1 Tax=Scleropages formosus TaxID=113540 RepID=A0A8C9SV89_SCLFO|nr:peroxisome biogenesis factor 2 isoform X1 [Scleropages formosus]